MIEIRDQDLRFTREEAASFLTEGMGLPLSEEDVATLSERTEGWIAGLQLAALSLRKREDLSSFVKDFAGSHRYLLDYVQQDILAQLPLTLKDFLLQTSILTRMNAALCQIVTAAPDEPACQQMLEELERTNLFVVPLDEQRQWYRFHDLFREALRARLQASQPELLPLLHIRAARFYEAQSEWQEAITHALAAPDYPYAASLMEQAAKPFWLRGEVRTVYTWVFSLPDTVLRAHIRLALNAALRFVNSVNLSNETLYVSMAAQMERTFTRMEGILRRKQELSLSDAEVALIERRLHLLHALIEARAILKRGDTEHLRLLSQETEELPQDEEVSWNMIPLSLTFWLAVMLQSEGASLVSRLRSAKQLMMEAGDHLVTIRVMSWLTRAYTYAAQLHLARQEALSALALVEQISGRTPIEGFLYYSLLIVSYTQNRLEEASDWLQRLLRSAQDWQQVELLVMGELFSARLALARGEISAAYQALHKLEALIEQEGYANHAPWVITLRVQLWLAEANLAEALQWAAQTTFSPDTWDPLHRWEVLMLARVSLAQQQYGSAVETLERFSQHFDQPGDIPTALEWMALYVVALHHTGKREQALGVATRLAQMTGSEGYARVYLDVGEPIIKQAREVLHPQHAEAQRGYIEPLSPQEQRVLRRLCAGQTYAEMAEALVVSPNTIKTQVSSIYRKLGVNRRAEAIARTSRLHLL
jgi:LuxR family maltose regulon positive regulatory protein